jgi:hypothetical protein
VDQRPGFACHGGLGERGAGEGYSCCPCKEAAALHAKRPPGFGSSLQCSMHAYH